MGWDGPVPLFLNTHVNKVDRKGRVSVPAPFRAALTGQAFSGIVAFPSFRAPAIEALDRARMEKLSESADDLAQFSEAHDDLSVAIFANAAELAFDGEGRIMLPETLAKHAGIDEMAAFVGLGQTFQIWNPARFDEYQRSATGRAKEKGAGLLLRRPAPGGETP